MLTMRQLVPPSVTHLARPFLLVDGRTVVLTAIASSLYVRIPIWKTDVYGNAECTLGHTVDELNLGSVAVDIVPCAHQCFVVLTQDNEVVVGRYQANLPTPRDSWLEDDVLHPNNSWIILHRGKLSTARLGSRSAPSMCPLFACGLSGTVVQCSIFRGWRHAIRIVIPSNASDTFLREKWILDVPHGVGSFSYGVAPFKRDVIEESDEDLLVQCTVAELAERKRTQCQSIVTPPCGSPPVRVIVDVGTADDTIVAMALMPRLHYSRNDSFVFVSAYRNSLKVYEVQSSSLLKDLAASISVDGSPYFVLTLPERMLVLSMLGGIHILSVLLLDGNTPIGMAAHTQSWGVIRLARSLQKVVAGVVLQPKDQPPHISTKEVLWLLLDNGTLTEVPLSAWLSQDGQTVLCDAPGIHSGDCEDGEWPQSCIAGLPSGFRAVSLLPLQHRRGCWAPYVGTGRYALLSDGVADTYIIDLIARRVVGGLCSQGAMTAACTGPGVSLLVAYSKGVLQRLSPGLNAPARVCAELAAIRYMQPLPHMDTTQSSSLVFHFLATTATHTVILEGAVGYLKKVRETHDFILDEPTLAVYSASASQTLVAATTTAAAVSPSVSPSSFFSFAQCTPTQLNLSGKCIPLRELLPEFESISHAYFGGNNFITIADSRRMAVLWIDNGNAPRVVIQESLPGDISHLTTWPINEEKQQWGVATCLWSHEIVVLLLNESFVHRYVLPISVVVISSFPLGNNIKGDTIYSSNTNTKNHKTTDDIYKMSGVGLTLVDRRTAVLHCDTVENSPTLKVLEDVDGDVFSADSCFPVFALGGKVNPRPHFNLMALRNNTVELVALDSSAVIMEQLGVALSPHSAGILGGGYCSYNSTSATTIVEGSPTFRCGFLLYIPSSSFYIIVLADATQLAVWSLPEVIPPTGKTASSSHRRSVLRRGPVAYQVTRSLQLPAVTTYEHRLSRIVYLPFSNTIVALTDRGEATSLVSTIDAETFRVLDALPMATREIPTCIESLSAGTAVATTSAAADAVVIGTAVQPLVTTSEPSEGRLLVLHVRPLRISAVACIQTGGVLDISVQGFGEEQLIAVAAIDRVLVYRLTGVTLTHLCSTDTKSACTTVALRYPFISCGLELWGTQYMQLLPEGTGTGDPDEWESLSTVSHNDEYENVPNMEINKNNSNKYEGEKESSVPQSSSGAGAPWSRWRGVSFTLKSCVLEPAAFAAVHSQSTYGDDFVRVDSARNLTTVSFRAPSAPVADEVAATRVVGVEGGYCSALTRAVRLPSCPLQLHVCERTGWSLWRHRHVPFVLCCEHPAALRRVGPLLLLPCADGGLRAAGEVPHAFAGPLLRVEQRLTELHDTTFALSRRWDSCTTASVHTNTTNINMNTRGIGGLRRTCHAVSVESAHAIQSATRVLRKQNFLCVDAVEEYWLLTMLAEVPDPMLGPSEALLIARKKGLLDEYLLHVWEEYAGELQDVDIGEVLYLW
ncbi:uncharacterized protein TM35_000192740 [Trypanosoma theileri]|uniref:Uncharacterized protein n=1 Tax=Trypanosoma theileri TaxID=67003 RepID=A0A1X0NV81_9TRYP|nr:uncharacterized protein TM35_000192740 [Trypanosoma theileri]ORC88030.1 hypothetical protein TM35_000192740 [Trypanosoma theileri]